MLGVTTHHYSTPFNGNPAKALDVVRNAVLGGAATMKRFVVLFPPGLVAFLLLVFHFMPEGRIPLIHLLWVLPWFAVAPLIGRLMERSTIRAVERLVRGMAQAGEAG